MDDKGLKVNFRINFQIGNSRSLHFEKQQKATQKNSHTLSLRNDSPFVKSPLFSFFKRSVVDDRVEGTERRNHKQKKPQADKVHAWRQILGNERKEGGKKREKGRYKKQGWTSSKVKKEKGKNTKKKKERKN